MILYSQKDPDYGDKNLGESKLIMKGHGCFVAAIATLYQKNPKDLLKVPGAFNAKGELISGKLAEYCGGAALPATTAAPAGWSIAKTNYWAPDYPTHFFLWNSTTGQRIDPLDLLPALEKNEKPFYNIIEYRPFTNIKLDTSAPIPPPIFVDVPAADPGAQEIQWARDNKLMNGMGDGKFFPDLPVSRRDLARVLFRYDRLPKEVNGSAGGAGRPS